MAKESKRPQPAAVQKEAGKEFTLSAVKLAELLKDIHCEVESAKEGRRSWEDQLVRNYEWRKGLVSRPFPDLPFKGASDLRFPLIPKYIDTLKSVFFQSVIDAPHVTRFLPLLNPKMTESAQNLELYMDAVFYGDTEWRRTVSVLIDRALEQGVCVAKITHEIVTEPATITKTRDEVRQAITALAAQRMAVSQKTGLPAQPITNDELRMLLAEEFNWDLDNPIHKARADGVLEQIKNGGEDSIQIIIDREVRNRAVVRPVQDLTRFVVPLDTTGLQESEWISYDMDYSPRQLRQEAVENGGRYHNVEEIIEKCRGAGDDESTGSGRNMATAQEMAEKLNPATESEQVICVRELCCWVPVGHIKRFNGKSFGNDETPVRAVITYCPIAQDLPLRVMELPYDHGRWPYEEYAYRQSTMRFYDHQGIPELLSPFAAEYNMARCAAINHLTITGSPPTVIHTASGINSSSFRQVGQVVKSKIPASEAINIPSFPDLSSGFEAQAQSLENFASEFLALPDLRLRQYGRPPTASQVNQVAAPASALLRYDLEHFHDFLGRVYRQVHELNKQYLFLTDDSAREFSEPSSPGTQRVLRKEDFNGEYVIQSGGDLQRLDEIQAFQMLFIAYQAAMNQPQIAPLIDPAQVNYTFFNKALGPVVARQWMRGKEEQQQAQQVFMQMQAQAAVQMQEGKKNPRNKRFAQVPNAGAGIVPQ